jgi:hypothetical protein
MELSNQVEISNMEVNLLMIHSTLNIEESNYSEIYNHYECSSFEEFITKIKNGSISLIVDFDYGMYSKMKHQFYTSDQRKALQFPQFIITIIGIIICAILAILLKDFNYLFLLLTIPIGAIISNKKIFRISFFIALICFILFLILSNYLVTLFFISILLNQLYQFGVRNMLEQFLKENAFKSEIIFYTLYCLNYFIIYRK